MAYLRNELTAPGSSPALSVGCSWKLRGLLIIGLGDIGASGLSHVPNRLQEQLNSLGGIMAQNSVLTPNYSAWILLTAYSFPLTSCILKRALVVQVATTSNIIYMCPELCSHPSSLLRAKVLRTFQ